MDDLFILELQEKTYDKKVLVAIASNSIKLLNSIQPWFKIKFKEDTLNRLTGLKYSRYDSKDNMLITKTINIEEAINIYHLLTQVLLLKVPGDVVEVGCYQGITAILLQQTLDQFKSGIRVHVYDSFMGLPDKTEQDGQTAFKRGDMATSKEKLMENFSNFNVKTPQIHAGWFKDTLPHELPDSICFAHLDGDVYSSTKEGLEAIYPRLSKGAIVVIDDYCDQDVLDINNLCPGVKGACDEFFRNKPEKVGILIAGCESQGYFRKE